MEIGEKLYYWRSRKDISIYNLSKISGISEGHIRNLENGKKQPTFKTLEALANALNISLLELLNTDSEAVYLSEGEKKLIELYRSLPKNKADILIEFYEKMKDWNTQMHVFNPSLFFIALNSFWLSCLSKYKN